MNNKKNNINFNDHVVTNAPTCALIEDYWILKTALDKVACGDVADAVELIDCCMRCIADTIDRFTKPAPGLEITPSISSAIAMSCENGIILDGQKDLLCAAGHPLSGAGCFLQCDGCEHKGECDPEEGRYLLKGGVSYQPGYHYDEERFVETLRKLYPCDAQDAAREHPLTEIQTPFGAIYVEDRDPAKREEPARVKIFDSEKRYFEYIEYAEDEVYDDVIAEMQSITAITELLSFVGYNFGYRLTEDWTVVSDILSDETSRYDSPESILENEWVNKIGDTYIVFEDWREGKA